MHVETLYVLQTVDWGEGGYFLPEFQVWSVTRSHHEVLYKNEEQPSSETQGAYAVNYVAQDGQQDSRDW